MIKNRTTENEWHANLDPRMQQTVLNSHSLPSIKDRNVSDVNKIHTVLHLLS